VFDNSCQYLDEGACDCNGNVEDCAGECGGPAEWYGDLCILLPGDVNDDAAVNVIDVVVIVQHILGSGELDPWQFSLADVTQDGSVNVLDVVAIVQYILDN
jgi:hypothetical protein